MFLVLAEKELVGHTGNVIANDDVPRFHLGKLLIGSGHRAFAAKIVNEEFFQTFHGAVAVLGNGGMVVNVSEQEAFQLTIPRHRGIAEAGKAFGRAANAFHG